MVLQNTHRYNLVMNDHLLKVTFPDRKGMVLIDTSGDNPIVVIRTDDGDGTNLETYEFGNHIYNANGV